MSLLSVLFVINQHLLRSVGDYNKHTTKSGFDWHCHQCWCWYGGFRDCTPCEILFPPFTLFWTIEQYIISANDKICHINGMQFQETSQKKNYDGWKVRLLRDSGNKMSRNFSIFWPELRWDVETFWPFLFHRSRYFSFIYSWLPITRTFKGNRKRFELLGDGTKGAELQN